MDFYPLWPPLAGFIGLLLLAGRPWFASADAPPSLRASRVATIDGLRGFLALSVVFYHGAIYHMYLSSGVWAVPPSGFYGLLGSGGVAVFFMITGYLFWCRLIDEAGRPDWMRFYVGRVFRIGPVYLLAILGMLALVMTQSGWRLLVPLGSFVRGIAPWLALGLLDQRDVNGHPATWILIAGVTWTLHFEWLFYLALPLMALVAGPGSIRAGVVLVAVAGGFLWIVRDDILGIQEPDPLCATLFLIGMGCATLDRRGWAARIGDHVASMVVVLLMLMLFRFCRTADTPLAMALLGTCFYLVISGCTLFGLLTHRASRRLGDISYGIYLLQGLVLAILFECRPVRDYALLSPARHWAVVLAAALILVVLAVVAHRWVERPGIALGRRMARLLSPPARGVQAPERVR